MYIWLVLTLNALALVEEAIYVAYLLPVAKPGESSYWLNEGP